MMKKRQWSTEEKKQIIEEALVAGASVGEIAGNHRRGPLWARRR
jgi:transposase-like protein